MSPKLLNIFLILVPVVMYFGVIDPVYTGNPGIVFTPEGSISAFQTQKYTYEQALEQIDLVTQGMKKLGDDYNKIDGAVKTKIETMLPDAIDPIKLTNEVTTIANKEGIAVTGVSVNTRASDRANPELGVYKVTFSADGHYQEIKKLIAAFERNLRFYIPDSVTIGRVERKEEDRRSNEVVDEEMLTASFVFNVYYMRTNK